MYNIKNIKIIGVGGCGYNGIMYLYSHNLKDVNFIIANTDKTFLDKIKDKKIKGILLGEDITEGKGTNGDVELGYKAAQKSYFKIINLLKGTDILFIRAGMGGGTGTGASLLIAEIAKEAEAKTIGLISMPFLFEGENRNKLAKKGLKKLKEKVDALFIVSNDKLIKRQSDKNKSLKEVLDEADNLFLYIIQRIICGYKL